MSENAARYLLDTTVLIDVSRRRPTTESWLRGAMDSADDVCVSAVSVAEFFAGLRPEHQTEWRTFINELTHYDVTKEIAIIAGSLRYHLARQGRVLQIPDALIAATAHVYGADLVTANTRDFALVGVRTVLLSS